MADIYGNNLKNVVTRLAEVGFESEIRGQDSARFIYSKSQNRGVEISWAGDEGIHVECWEGLQENSSKNEETVNSFEIAIKRTIEWLSNKP